MGGIEDGTMQGDYFSVSNSCPDVAVQQAVAHFRSETLAAAFLRREEKQSQESKPQNPVLVVPTKSFELLL